jgi:hypothetical protein
MITPERLRQLVSYDPETGVFTNRVARPRVSVGQELGWKNGKGYRCMAMDGVTYPASRLAWLWLHGEWPAAMVDHIDRDRLNNRASNLRLATNAENSRNAKLSKRNASGAKGVYWYARHEKWTAQIRVNRKLLSLGYFAQKADAIAARQEAEREHFGEFAGASC